MRGVIDPFGIDAPTEVADENHFCRIIPVCSILCWLFCWGWGGSIVVEGLEEESRQYKKMLWKVILAGILFKCITLRYPN